MAQYVSAAGADEEASRIRQAELALEPMSREQLLVLAVSGERGEENVVSTVTQPLRGALFAWR